MPNINRRFFLSSVAKFIAGGATLSACSTITNPFDNFISVGFKEGVASGDPLSDRVIIWTRLSPILKGENKTRVRIDNVVWEIAIDSDFKSVVKQGTATAKSTNDFCIKVDVTGLDQDTTYFYRFSYNQITSSIGRTKTLPLNESNETRFAVVSCSNYGHGYFHVYAEIAKRNDLNFVLHLGDYIYEYRDDVYSDPKLVATDRQLEPQHETLSLDDYRARYRCYRGDKDLQAVHGSHPFIVVWDDHEIANDAWIDGAEGHQNNEGDWQQRKLNALQAYREYMPIRDPQVGSDSMQIYRQFNIGNLASLIMLDTRLIGREQQLNYGNGTVDQNQLQDPSRDLLGQYQEDWLNTKLVESRDAGQPWQILGQQLLTGKICMPDVSDIMAPKDQGQRQLMNSIIDLGKRDLPLNLDAWDGYNAAKQRLLHSYRERANNVISLAGDTHNSWAFELKPENMHKSVAVEFGTPSVSSPGMESWLPTSDQATAAQRMVQKNPELVYHDNQRRGWLELRLNHEFAESRFHFIDNVKSLNYKVLEGQIFRVSVGEHRIDASSQS